MEGLVGGVMGLDCEVEGVVGFTVDGVYFSSAIGVEVSHAFLR